MKVYIGCFGSGLGHASRMLEVARELRKRGASIVFSSSGEVAGLIQRMGYECNVLPLADVKYSPEGNFSLKQTLLASPTILARTYQQLFDEVRNIGAFAPDVVLSDSSLSTLIAAKLHRLPTFTVLNQLNLTDSHVRRRVPSRILSVGTSAGMGTLWEFSDEVLLPDLPPPNTISEKNLWGSKVEKTRYVGFLSPSGSKEPDQAAVQLMNTDLPLIFWQVSGPPKTRKPLLKIAIESAKALSEKYVFVVSGGDPLASTTPSKIEGGWYYGWCPIADYYFEACDLVVSRAGHGTIGQTITSGKPSLIIPIPRQPEQEGNASKAAALGISLVLKQEGTATGEISRAIDRLLGGSYASKAKQIGTVSRGFDAKGEIVRTLENAAR